ncbi:MAG: DUF6125 family protein [Candidatus Lokiarchaeia archaeon]
MTLFDKLSKQELKELLIKCWMTHDGMWFYHCFLEFGIDTANKLNKEAIKSLSAIEVQRIKKARGMEKERIETFEQLKKMVNAVFSVVKGDFMDFEYSFLSENCLHWEQKKCFAHEGMKRIGVSEKYECGLLYRVQCWLDILGVKYSINPQTDTCILNSCEKCSGDFVFYF